ncbi:MAG: hypothetical protein KDB27_18225 [Planctomycetales bacterium]|nr:hypothetical protein [Planctomycetales bacterium]
MRILGQESLENREMMSATPWGSSPVNLADGHGSNSSQAEVANQVAESMNSNRGRIVAVSEASTSSPNANSVDAVFANQGDTVQGGLYGERTLERREAAITGIILDDHLPPQDWTMPW